MIPADWHHSKLCRSILLALAFLAIAGASPQRAQTDPEPPAAGAPNHERTADNLSWGVTGTVSAFLSSSIDYVAVARFSGSAPSRAGVWQVGLQTTVAVLSASGSGTMIVDDLDYVAEASLEQKQGSLIWAPLTQVRGSEQVDREGSLGVVLAGFRLARRAPEKRFAWEIEALATLNDWGIDTHGALKASGKWRVHRGARWVIGLKGAVDSLMLNSADDAIKSDLMIGPYLQLHRPRGMRLSFHALYYRGENPLGLGDTGVLVGVRFDDRSARGRDVLLPSLRAALAVGGGDDGVRARQVLDLTSTSFQLFGNPWRARLLADNTLVDSNLNDLYYIIVGGIERSTGSVLPGLSFYHRSGHLLDQPNDRRLSLNVVEVGFRTPGWEADLPAWPSSQRVAGEVWLGGVVSSDFGEDQNWSARAAAQWILPGNWRRAAPFIGGRVQQGEVEGWAGQGGWVTPRGLSLSILAERDSQRLQSPDTSLTLLLGRRF
ncbi:MAG: hypothetical protein O7F16_05220 [Acidobacteria bacterium]|nr:hypothetical protein [Acidobacteriota bacterium]